MAPVTLWHLSQIYTVGVFIQNHLVIYAVKQCAQHLTFLVPVTLPPFSRENSLTTMIQFCWLLWWPYKLSILPIFLESLQQHINFVRPGTKTKKSMKKPNTGLLHVSPDWRFMSDFTGKLLIPSWIVISQRRPDIVIF